MKPGNGGTEPFDCRSPLGARLGSCEETPCNSSTAPEASFRAARRRGTRRHQATVLRYRPGPYYSTHATLHVDDAQAGREFVRRLSPDVESAAD